MSYIQLPYGFVKNNKQIQFNLPSDFEELQFYKEVPFISYESPSDYGNEIQEDLNAIVGYDEKFNNAIARHALDRKDENIFSNPNPINVTFHDMKKFDLVNPLIGKLASQARASKLTDYELTKKLLEQGEIDNLQLRLDALKYGINKDDDDDEDGGTGRGGGRGGGDDGMPGPNLRKTPQQEIDEITKG